MTPDVQAARDRITAVLALRDSTIDPDPDLIVVPGAAARFAEDLRLILAALDPAETPIDRIPTRGPIDYLEVRREQHPRTVRNFRGLTPADEPNDTITEQHTHTHGPA